MGRTLAIPRQVVPETGFNPLRESNKKRQTIHAIGC